MDQIQDFVDERQKAWCIHCGGWIGALKTNRDHVPSKTLLRIPFPDNLPVVEICEKCNSSFSIDEEYMAAFLGAVLTGSTAPENQTLPAAKRIFERNAKLQARIEKAKTKYKTQGGDTRTVWRPEQDRINRVAVKNARGHAFYEFGEPMLEDPAHVWAVPLETLTADQRTAFEDIEPGPGWPEVGSRMLTRVITGQDLSGAWVVVQDDVYRYAIAQQGKLLIRAVLFEYLATEVFWDG